MDAIAALRQARHEFESRMATIIEDQWANTTPCPEWDVRALVNHMMLGNRMTAQLHAGMATDQVVAGLNDDLVGQADDLSAATLADDVPLQDRYLDTFGRRP